MLKRPTLFVAAIVGLSFLNTDVRGGNTRAVTATPPEPLKVEEKFSTLRPVQEALDRLTAAVKALKDNPDAQTEKQLARSDLRAQEDMARWAYWMVVATGATVVLTLIGVILIWRTLVHTSRAAIASEQMAAQTVLATKAAIDAATAADLTANAMLGMESPIIRPAGIHKSIDGTNIKIHGIIFRNYGRTAAFPLSADVGIAISFHRPEWISMTRSIEIPSNQVIEPEPQEKGFFCSFDFDYEVSPPEYEAILTNEVTVWLDGRVHYSDFLDRHHLLSLRWHLDNKDSRLVFILDRCRRIDLQSDETQKAEEEAA